MSPVHEVGKRLFCLCFHPKDANTVKSFMSSSDKPQDFSRVVRSNTQPLGKLPDLPKESYSPLRVWITSVVTILLVVIIVVIVYEHFIERSMVTLTSMLEVAFVSITLSLLIPPLLYLFSYRPLLSNVTQLHKTEGELDLLATALQSADHGVVITDSQGTIQWLNPAFARTTGLPSAELKGRSLRLFESNRISAAGEERWETILAGNVWKEELSLSHANGRTYIKEQIINPVRGEHGEISNLIFIEKDVTEQRRLEKTTATLASAALALNESLQLDDVLDVLLDLLISGAVYANAAVVLLHHESRWTVRACRGPDFGQSSGQREWLTEFGALDSPPIQTMLTTRQLVAVQDTAVSSEYHPFNKNGRNWLGIPLVVNGRVIGFCILDREAPYLFMPAEIQLTEALVHQAAGAIENARLFEEARVNRERLKSLSHRLVEIQETERRSIARELHDEAGQALASLRIQLALLALHADDPEMIRTRVPEVQQQVDEVSENLHRLAVNLRPASLDHSGLITALSQHVQTIRQQYGLKGEFEVCGFDRRLPPEMETAVYRIVQEALTNVVRHAEATRVDVLLKHNGSHFYLIIEDNGKGFDPLRMMSELVVSDHLGIIGIRERAEMLGGILTLDSSIGNGTTLKIEVPYDNSRIAR